MPFEHVTKISGLSSWFLFVFKASIDGYTTGMQADGGAFRGTLCIVGCGFSWQHWPQLLITYGNRNISFSTTRQSDHSKDILRDLIMCNMGVQEVFIYIVSWTQISIYITCMFSLRMVLAIWLLLGHQGTFTLEQPASSIIMRHHRLRQLLKVIRVPTLNFLQKRKIKKDIVWRHVHQ